MENNMECEELINQLIYHVQDSEHGYDVRVTKDEQEYKFKVECKDGRINLVVTD